MTGAAERERPNTDLPKKQPTVLLGQWAWLEGSGRNGAPRAGSRVVAVSFRWPPVDDRTAASDLAD